jgi:hypothetical protein
MERAPESCHAGQRRTCDACKKSMQWFLTANGYAVSLSRMETGFDTNKRGLSPETFGILESDRLMYFQQRISRRATWLSLLTLNDGTQAETVRQEAWTAAKQERMD